MKLDSLLVKNYKSLKDFKINFKHSLGILIGINESGKSAILNTIRFLDDEYSDYKYSRDFTFEFEENLGEGKSEFIFILKLSQEEIKNLVKNIYKGYMDTPTALHSLNLDKILSSGYVESIVSFDQNNNKNKDTIFKFDEERLDIKPNFYKIKDSSENQNFEIKLNDGTYIPNNLKYFDYGKCLNLSQIKMHLEELTKEIFLNDIQTHILNFVKTNKPKIIYWKYDEKYLLPSQVNIDEFRNNPDICIPLKLFFHLSGSDDIAKTIDQRRTTTTRFKTLTELVSRKATEHISKIWPEFKNKSIKIWDDTRNFNIGIEEKGVFFPMSARSDGFKRFVSFIITISAESSSGRLKNNIIILDEPDVSLHPSGIKSFLNELKKISEYNQCFVSTHSIFMIDSEEKERHFRVVKKDGITNLLPVTEDSLTDEEILFRTLGYSIYDVIKHKTIMVEGFLDREIMKILSNSLEQRGVSNIDLDSIAIIGCGGAGGISSRLDLLSSDTNRKFLVTVDNDQAGRNAKTTILKENTDLQNNVYTFEDIVRSSKSNFTVEDFIPSNWMSEILNKHLKDVIGLNTKKEFLYKSDSKGILEEWEKFVNENYGGDRRLKDGFKNKIPSLLYNKLETGIADKPSEVFKYFIKYTEFVNSAFKNLKSIRG